MKGAPRGALSSHTRAHTQAEERMSGNGARSNNIGRREFRCFVGCFSPQEGRVQTASFVAEFTQYGSCLLLENFSTQPAGSGASLAAAGTGAGAASPAGAGAGAGAAGVAAAADAAGV